MLGDGTSRTVPDLSSEVGVSQRRVSELLDGLRAGGVNLVVHPAHCLACGFRFTKRERARRPSRCPTCRSGRIGRATFTLE